MKRSPMNGDLFIVYRQDCGQPVLFFTKFFEFGSTAKWVRNIRDSTIGLIIHRLRLLIYSIQYTLLQPILVKEGTYMAQKVRCDLNMGNNLRRLRDFSGLSQEKLCAELQRRGCDIGRTTYAKYEAGELNIKASVIVTLKKIYNCSYDDFFAGLE